MYQNAAKTYQQANFLTANPMKLVLMCYEGAINNLKLARDSYLTEDYETKGKALKKTIDIIHELNASLDMKKGGEIAGNLRTLYNYITKILSEADLKKEIKIFDKVILMLEELESSWKTVASQAISGTEEGKKNQIGELKAIKTHHIGTAAYGKVVTAATARAWSV